MRIRYFIPLLLAIPALFGFLADLSGIVPPIPVMTIAMAGMILLLFQQEDHKLGKFLAEMAHAFREAAHHHK